MRNAFASEMTSLATEDKSIVLLSGDIGNRLFDKFKSLCPDRFFNCGVAEANMVSMAAGMAMCGLRPVTYTIAPFNTLRCLEQIKVDVCYPALPVVMVGVGAGLSYAANGVTHQSCEDIAFLRILPNMTVICPGDAWEVRVALKQALQLQGPVYLRLGKKNEPLVHSQAPTLQIAKALIVREGEDVCILSTGNMLPIAMEAAETLLMSRVSAQVVSFHTVKPLDAEFLSAVFCKFKLVVTIEEHSVLGGLGGSISEWLSSQHPIKAHLLTLGTGDVFLHEAGGQDYARSYFGLNPSGIADRVLSAYRKTLEWEEGI